MIKKMVVLAFFSVLSLISFAQDARQEVIWNAAYNRVVRQMDHWFTDGDFPRCIQVLRLLHILDPSDYEIATDLGWMLGNIARPAEELAIYIEYRKAYPKDPDAALPEAQFYFNKKQYAKIPEILEPKIAMKPHPNVFRILAHAYDRTGKFKDSVRVWRAFIALHPEDEAAKLNLARVEKKLKGTE